MVLGSSLLTPLGCKKQLGFLGLALEFLALSEGTDRNFGRKRSVCA